MSAEQVIPPDTVPRQRCLVLDDSPFALHSVVAMLERQSLSVVAALSSAAQTVKNFEVGSVDVAVIDLHLGVGPSGIEVARALREQEPTLGILFISVCSDPRLLGVSLSRVPTNTIQLSKDDITDSKVLADAVQLAWSLGMGGRTGGARATPGMIESPVLTDTQAETLRLIARGHSNRDIARIRVVTERAVERSTSRLLRQFNIPISSDVSPRVLLADAYWRLRFPVGAPDRAEFLNESGTQITSTHPNLPSG